MGKVLGNQMSLPIFFSHKGKIMAYFEEFLQGYHTRQIEIPNLPEFEAIEKLNPAYTFFLTGSRYFGDFQPKSDWDFYIGYSPYLVDALVELGFKYSKDSQYNDPSICYVLTLPKTVKETWREDGTGTIEITCPKIDIQVIKADWMTAKNCTQLYLLERKHDYLKADKEKRKFLWEAMLQAMKLVHG